MLTETRTSSQAPDIARQNSTPLAYYARAVWNRRVLVLLIIFGLTLPAVVVSLIQPKVYSASAYLVLAQQSLDSNLNVDTSEVSDARVTAEVATVSSDQVTALAAARGATGPVSVTSTSKSNLLVLTARAGDPQAAASTANAFADAYVEFKITGQRASIDTAIAELQRRLNDANGQVAASGDATGVAASQASAAVLQQQSLEGQLGRLQVQRAVANGDATVVNRAAPPARPVSPNPFRDGALALILGLALGIGVAILIETTRTRTATARISGADGAPAPRPRPTPHDQRSPKDVQVDQATMPALRNHASTLNGR